MVGLLKFASIPLAAINRNIQIVQADVIEDISKKIIALMIAFYFNVL